MSSVEARVDKAIDEGRVSPRNRAKWIRNIKANASTAILMDKLEPVLADRAPFDPTTWKL
ncbi:MULTISPECIES: hypothetical protein [Actinomycetes]|uniref:hypothetical protein n=1 Tax=Actinomycetes TaxID=1760 RepID=UPI0004BED6C4|nr:MULTISPECIES: hypothetical protein [Actinomycetes]